MVDSKLAMVTAKARAARVRRLSRLSASPGPLNTTPAGIPNEGGGYLDVEVATLPRDVLRRIKATRNLLDALIVRIRRRNPLAVANNGRTTDWEFHAVKANRQRWTRALAELGGFENMPSFYAMVDRLVDHWSTQRILEKRVAQLMSLQRWLTVLEIEAMSLNGGIGVIEKNHLAQGSPPSESILTRELLRRRGPYFVRQSIVVSYCCGVPASRVRPQHQVFDGLLRVSALLGQADRDCSGLDRVLLEGMDIEQMPPEMKAAWLRGKAKFDRIRPFMDVPFFDALQRATGPLAAGLSLEADRRAGVPAS